jgi:hypothetical protein
MIGQIRFHATALGQIASAQLFYFFIFFFSAALSI